MLQPRLRGEGAQVGGPERRVDPVVGHVHRAERPVEVAGERAQVEPLAREAEHERPVALGRMAARAGEGDVPPRRCLDLDRAAHDPVVRHDEAEPLGGRAIPDGREREIDLHRVALERPLAGADVAGQVDRRGVEHAPFVEAPVAGRPTAHPQPPHARREHRQRVPVVPGVVDAGTGERVVREPLRGVRRVGGGDARLHRGAPHDRVRLERVRVGHGVARSLRAGPEHRDRERRPQPAHSDVEQAQCPVISSNAQ